MTVKVQLLALVALVGALVTSVSAESNQTYLEHEWEWGFKSNFAIDVTSAVTGGWRITLQFNKPVASLQIWRASIVSVSKDKKVYELKNKLWNRQLMKGDWLKMALLGNKTVWGSPAPIAKVLFRRVGVTQATTQPPTRTPSQPPTQPTTQPCVCTQSPTQLPTQPPTQSPSPSSTQPVPRRFFASPPPPGGYSHILAIRVCATGEGMVFKPFGLVKGMVFKPFGLVEGMVFRPFGLI